jgi:3-dehydroquinate synthetase
MFTLNKENLQEKISQSKFIIIDEKILHFHPFLEKLIKDQVVYKITGNPEDSKTLEVFERITNSFIERNITRFDKIYAIGGGATSDLAGFVAATILRGIQWEVYPTSFLSMIDASIGGKVGINNKFGKNLIGSFHLPESVFIYSPFLESLPHKDYQSGLGELVKYYFISDMVSKTNFKHKNEVIESCINFKNQIVESDFKESGKRKVLNFGHTFGHAIERCLELPHGISVYFGIRMLIDFLQPEFKEYFQKISNDLDIDFDWKDKMDFDTFFFYLEKDKKRNGSLIEFIKIKSVGDSYTEKINIVQLKRKMKEHECYNNYFK